MARYELTIYRYDERRSHEKKRLDVLKSTTFEIEGSHDRAAVEARRLASDLGGAGARLRTCSPGQTATKGVRGVFFAILELPARGARA